MTIFFHEEIMKKKIHNPNEDENTFSIVLKNKFKILNRDFDLINKVYNSKYKQNILIDKNETDDQLVLEILFSIIKEIASTNETNFSNDLYSLLRHIIFLFKMNDYWMFFVLPKYIPEISNEKGILPIENEFKNEMSILLEKNNNLSKSDFLKICLIHYRKYNYPLNLVICESVLNYLLNFNGKENEIFNNLDDYFEKIMNFSVNILKFDEKTIYFIINSLFFNKIIEKILFNVFEIKERSNEIFDLYLNFLTKMLTVIDKKKDPSHQKSEIKLKKILKSIRFQKSNMIFERIKRIFLNLNFFFIKDDKKVIILIKLLYISFKAQ